MNSNRFIAIALIFLTGFAAYGHEKIWPEKRLRHAWPEAQSFTSKQTSLSTAQTSKLESEGVKIGAVDRNLTFYFPQGKDPKSQVSKTLGVVLFVDEYGENGKMDISIAMGSDGRVKGVDLWEQSENPLVNQDTFLKQFLGKSKSDSFKDPAGFAIVAAAPKASRAVASAVKKALELTDATFGKSKDTK